MVQLTEHASKLLLARFGVPVPEGRLVSDRVSAMSAALALGPDVAVKAQVPVGGRGRAGGILRALSAAAAADAFERVTAISIGNLRALQALVEPWRSIDRELYLAVIVDPVAREPTLLFGAHGGIDVESSDPPFRLALREDGSVPAAVLRRAVTSCGLPSGIVEQIREIAASLARGFHALDAQLVEINPLGVTSDGRAIAVDARIVADDAALFRQPEIRQIVSDMSPRREEDLVRERTGLEYVRLQGRLGLISGGAGMTMAVMDQISSMGASAACFLDCSANPTPAGYGAALNLLLEDPSVDAIFISIFGGLTRVDRVAKTLTGLIATLAPRKPVTVRLMGTNAEAADAILAEAGLRNHHDLDDAIGAAIRTLARPISVLA